MRFNQARDGFGMKLLLCFASAVFALHVEATQALLAPAGTRIIATTLPDQNSSSPAVVSQFTISATANFSTASATNPANYTLRGAGNNGAVGDADDVLYPITATVAGTNATLTFPNAPLQPGRYRFDTSAGLQDATGGAVATFSREFAIVQPIGGRIESTSNDRLEEATVLPMAETPSGTRFFTALGVGSFSSGTDVDYWRFDAEAGDRITVRAVTDGSAQPQVQLRTAANGFVTSGTAGNGFSTFQDFAVPSPGTFYLRVEGNRYAPYALRVDLSREPQLETEPNDALGSADPVRMKFLSGAYAAALGGSIERGDSADVFAIGHLTAGDTLSVNVLLPAGSSLSANSVSLRLFRAGTAPAIATSDTGILNLNLTADGIHYLSIDAKDGIGVRAQYLLNVNVLDPVRPRVLSVSLPEEGQSTRAVLKSFVIDFSEEMNPAMVDNAANYELRNAGRDNQFNTPDDELYLVSGESYSGGLSATMQLPDGPLQPGSYRLRINTGVNDRAGNPLAGAFQRAFTVEADPEYVTENRSNDSFATATPIGTVTRTPDYTFTPGDDYPAGNGSYSIDAGDLNGDGNLDLAIANYQAQSVTLLTGMGNGTFGTNSALPVDGNPYFVRTADFNNDQRLDLVTANAGVNSFSVLWRKADGSFAKEKIDLGGTPRALAFGDFNRDGNLDLATVYGSVLAVALGSGSGKFGPAQATEFALRGPYGIAAADINKDGTLDLLVANESGSTVTVLMGKGDGTFTASATLPVSGQPRHVALADLDNDGDNDLAVLCANENRVDLFLNDGRGAFSLRKSIETQGSDAYDLRLADVSGDGLPDIVIAQYGQNRVSILRSVSAGDFAPVAHFQGRGNPIAVAIGDYNKDGLMEIATANYNGRSVTLFQPNVVKQLSADANLPELRLLSARGSLANSDDVDYFSFSANAGETLSLAIETGTNASSLYVQIFRPDGQRVEGFYGSGNGNGQLRPYAFPQAGTYYITVSPNNTYFKEYRLKGVITGPALQHEAENNDGTSQANALSFAAAGTNKIARVVGYATADDLSTGDYFVLGTLPSGTPVNVSVRQPSTSAFSPILEIVKGQTTLATATGGKDLAYTVPAGGDALLHLRIRGTNGSKTIGIGAIYVADLKLGSEATPPRITNVDLPEAGETSRVISRFRIQFDEELDPRFNKIGREFVFRGNSAYLASPNAMNWTAARAFAGSLNGTLVIVNDAEENAWVRDQFTPGGTIWLGLSDTENEGVLRWESGETVTFSRWGDNEPSNSSDRDYASMSYAGTWALNGNANFYAVVEIPADDSDGDGVPDAADPFPHDPQNGFDLRATGPDGLFDTPDDHVFRIGSAGYSSGLSADFYIEDGPLPAGVYRLRITRSITDKAGNSLTDDYVRNFTVSAPAEYTLEDANNDSFANATPLVAPAKNGDGSFSRAFRMPVGRNPYAICSADFNEDGKPDLATVNYSESTVSVLFGNGDGTLTPDRTFPVGRNPIFLTTGDFDRDGHKDIVTANAGTGGVSILYGDGKGGFREAVHVVTANSPQWLATGDFNKDGFEDIASANYGTATISVVFGTLEGTNRVTTYTCGNNPRTIVAGDFDSDGNLDVVTGNAGENSLSYLAGDGKGGLGQPKKVSGVTGISALRAADLNQDGKLDLLVMTSSTATIDAYLGDGSGGFQKSGSYSYGAGQDYDFILADVNGDRIPDIIVGHYAQNQLVVLFGKSDGTFQPLVSFQGAGSPISAAVGDFDRDGLTDIASADYGEQRVSIYRANALKALPADPVLTTLRSISGRGSLLNQEDEDYFSFSAVAGQTLLVAGEAPGAASAASLHFQLLRANGETVGNFYTAGDGVGQGQSVRIPATGTYYVAVSYNNVFTGEYRFRVLLADAGVALENENNSPVTSANALAFSLSNGESRSAVAGLFATGDNGDFYKLGNVPVGSPIEIRLRKGSRNGTAPKLELYRGTDRVVSSPEGVLALNYTVPNGGEGIYSVGVSAKPGTTPLGLFTDYLVEATLKNEQVPPTIQAVSLPEDGTTSVELIDQFTLTASEELNPALNRLSYRFRKFGNNYYTTTSRALTWSGAEAEAQSIGAYLVTVNDGAENEWLARTFATSSSLWIGFNDFAEEGKFVWTSGEPATFTSWNGGEPNNSGDEDATQLYSSGLWNDLSGNGSLLGIIEVPGGSNDSDRDGIPDSIDPYPGDPLNLVDLREAGQDGSFGTADDRSYAVRPVLYGGGLTVTFDILNSPLPPGKYRLTITRSLKDAAGNSIAQPYVRTFGVQPVPPFVLEGGASDDLKNATPLGAEGGANGTLRIGATLPIDRRVWGSSTADFNGDGRPDIVLTVYDRAIASVYLGTASGEFAAPLDLPTGNNPFYVLTGDFNRDGRPDFAVANYGSSSLSLYLGRGDGTFAPRQDATTGVSPIMIAAGDLNGDGIPELVVANYSGANVTVVSSLRNWETNSVQNFPAGTQARGISLGDLNGDGFLDVLVACAGEDRIALLTGKGNGQFNLPIKFDAGNEPRYLEISDFDGDGRLDWVVINNGSSSLEIFYGDGQGGYVRRVPMQVAANDVYQLLLRDLNQDGRKDILLVGYSPGTLTVLLEKGGGEFAPPVAYPVNANPISAAVADFDQDGVLDVLSGNYGQSSLTYFHGGRFLKPPSDPTTGTTLLSARGTLLNPDDVDYYTFSGRAGQRVALTAETTPAGTQNGLTYKILRPGGAELASAGGGGAGLASLGPVTLPLDGNYYVAVSPNYSFLGEYRLRVIVLDSDGQLEAEPNNSLPGNAVDYTRNGSTRRASIVGTAAGGGDLDIFSVGIIEPGSRVTLDLTTIAPNVPLTISILGTDGRELASPIVNGRTLEFTVPETVKENLYARVNAFTLSPGLDRSAADKYSLYLDGAGDYVSVEDSPALRPQSLTLEGWFNFANPTSFQVLLSKPAGRGPLNSYAVWSSGNTLLGVISGPDGESAQVSKAWAPKAGVWYHIAFVFDDAANTETLYVDGESLVSAPVARSIGYDNHPLLIGAESENENITYYFRGGIDEVRLWGLARTQSEIRATKNLRLSGQEAGLRGYWRFDEGSGSTSIDASGNATPARLMKTPDWVPAAESFEPGSVLAQYRLTISIQDQNPPVITGTSLPGEGSTVTEMLSRIRVSFSEGLDSNFAGMNRALFARNGHAYLLTPSGMSWLAARDLANELGGYLVVVNDRAENDWLRDTFGFVQNFWLGLSDRAQEGLFVWERGQLSQFTSWRAGEPRDDGDEDFVAMNVSGLWNDARLYSNYRAVIEFDGVDSDGDGLPDAIDPVPNQKLNYFDLREAGRDGVFDTSDDQLYQLAPRDYNGAADVDLLVLNGPLLPGKYRFTATTALLDQNGNALPAAFVRTFTIAPQGGFLGEPAIDDSFADAVPLGGSTGGALFGNYRLSEPVPTANNPYFLAMEDLNGDGFADLVVPNYGAQAVNILLGDRLGNFTPSKSYKVTAGPVDVEVRDLNKDGKLDIIVSGYTSARATVLLGAGDGSFTESAVYTLPGAGYRVVTGDFDGDRSIDFAVGNQNQATVSVFFGDGSGKFAGPTNINVSAVPRGLAAGDLNGDGRDDLFVATESAGKRMVLFGNSRRAFDPLPAADLPGDGRAVVLTDVDGSAGAEAIVATQNGRILIFHNNGQGTFTEALNLASGVTDGYDLLVADLNGDGLKDIALASYGSSRVSFLYQLPGFKFSSPLIYTVSGGPISLLAGDFDKNGTTDLLVSLYSSHALAYLYGTGQAALPEDSSNPGIRLGGARGTFTNAKDNDYWSFYARAGDTFRLSLSWLGSSGVAYATLYGPNYEQFGDGIGVGSANTIDTGARVVPVTGTYYIVVSSSGDIAGEYALRTTIAEPPAAMEVEPNNSVATGTLLNFAKEGEVNRASAEGYIRAPNDLDYFALGNLAAGTSIYLSATLVGPGNPLIPIVAVYDANNGYVVEAEGGQAFDNVAEVRITRAGNYYALVRGAGTTSGLAAQYVLDARVVPTGSLSFPNLQVTSITPPQVTQLLSGRTATIGYSVRNAGAIATPVANWSDRISLSANEFIGDGDDIVLGSFPHAGALQAGGSYDASANVEIPDGLQGEYYLLVSADSAQQVPEFLLEGDNTRISDTKIKVLLSAYPDLVVEGLNAAVGPTGPIQLTWQTANRGNGSTTRAFKESIVLRNVGTGALVGAPIEQTVDAVLTAANSIVRTASLPRPASGRYEVTVLTDAADNLFEYGSNGHAGAEQNAFTTTFTLLLVNRPPTIAQVNPLSVPEDGTVSVPLQVDDAETGANSVFVSALASDPGILPPALITITGSGASRTLVLKPAPNQNGDLVVTVTATDGLLSSRMSFPLRVVAVNDAPTISRIDAIEIDEGETSGPIRFNVGDVESDPATLTVSAISSSNPNLLPLTNIGFGGSSAARVAVVRPVAKKFGQSLVTFRVSDGEQSASTSFLVTVRAVNDPPSISAIPDVAARPGTSFAPIAFKVNDEESGPNPLVLAKSSSNPVLVPVENIAFSGTGEDRTVTILPATGQKGASTITVTVFDPQGASAVASFEVLVSDSSLLITTQPVSRSVAEGSPLQFEVKAAGTGPLAYQWFFNGAAKPRETNSTLSISAAQASDNGTYFVQVTDSTGTVSSREAKLRVLKGIVIEAQPVSQSVPVGGNAAFSVKALGAEPLSYQWYFNGNIVPDAVASTLLVSEAQLRDAGSYYVVISNGSGFRQSAEATLTVRDRLRFAAEVQDRIIREGETLSLQPEVFGTGLSYRWYLRGEPIDATGPFYIKPNATRADSGDYRLEARGAEGAIFSRSIRVIVVAAPVISKQPIAQTVALGRGTQLSVIASGTEPFQYEWFRDGESIGATAGPALTLANAAAETQGDYTVKVSNIAGEVLSQPARVTVVEGLRIVTQPAPQSKLVGETATLSVEALGTGLSFQWFYRGVPISGATAPTLSIPNAKLTDSGDYSVSIANAAGAIRSLDVPLSILAPPTITRQPQSQEGLIGTSARLAVAVSGSDPLTYQWTRNGVAIQNATGPVLVLNNLQEQDDGDYRIQVRNFAGSVISDAATLRVYRGVQIASQPVGGRIRAGGQLNLTVVATGSEPLRYQWKLNGIDIPNATSPTYAATAQGRYSVRVANPAGGVLSQPAFIEVLEPVSFAVQPQPVTGKVGETAIFRVVPDGSGVLTYQWQFNGQDIPGATGATLLIRSASPDAQGLYRVLVSNELGSEMSSEVALTVLAEPIITSAPVSQSVAPGANLTLTVAAQGAAPLTYQWALNGVVIPGANGASFNIGNAQPTNSGRYTVQVANPGGTTRATATVLIQAPSLALADNRADAPTVSTGSGSFRGSNVGATAEPGEPSHFPNQPAAASVWFRWTAPASGIVDFTTAGSSLDTLLAAYTLSAQAQLQPVANNDDGGAFKTSAIEFNAVQGTTYFLAIDGYKGATGDIVISWLLQQKLPRLPRITRQPVSFTSLIGGSAQFSVEASASDGGGLTYQWFYYNTPLAGRTTPTLTLANVQAANVGRYSVRVSNAADASYTLLSDTAELQMNLIETGLEGPSVSTSDKPDLSAPAGPPQTIGTRRIRILTSVARGYTGSQVFSTIGAVSDFGEPSHCGVNGGASSWSLYEPPASGSLLVTTDGSSFDTVLAVYRGTGNDFASMVLLGCDNNSGVDGQDSRIVVPVNPGEFIFIVVDGVNGASGTVQLNYTLSQPPTITVQPRIAGIQAAAASGQVPNGAKVTLEASATSGAPVFYQWRRNGRTLAAATNSTLVINGFGAANTGNYTVTVSNFAGQTYSDAVALDLQSAAEIATPLQNQSTVLGGSAVFSVAANGTDPITYEWRFNGSILSGQTEPNLVLNNVQTSQAGTYQVRVSNAGASVTSDATLTVLEPVLITQQPPSRQVAQNGSTTLTVSASGSPSLGYQWRFNGVDLPGQNSAQLALQNLTPQNAGAYSVVVSNSISTAISGQAQVDVVVPVAIVQQPQNQTISGATTTQFEVVASGTEPISYQWRFNGTPIGGAASRILVLENLTPANAGNYSVVVNNAAGIPVTSQNASLTLAAPPTISQQPQSQSVALGANVTFTVTAAGSGTLNYQWRFNGVHIPGQTGPSLTLNNLSAAQAGAYTVAVDNSVGSIISAPAELAVSSAIVIVQQPASQTVLEGSTVFFNVLATGTGPLAYQWFRNGAPLANATNDTLTLTNAATSLAGNYTVSVSNPGGTNTSAIATLAINALPVITGQPQSQQVASGAPAQFSVAVSGSGPLAFQWRFNGVNMPSQTNATLQIAAAGLANEGDYSVLVSNPAGVAASSLAALFINRGDLNVSARAENGEIVVRVSGPAGRQIDLEASQNLQAWSAIGSLTLDAGQAESRQTTNSAPFRFYRALLKP